MKKTARNDEMRYLVRAKYWTLEEAGQKFGVSRQRVSQIVGKIGRGGCAKRKEMRRARITTTQKESA